jgi:hypothetical protein
MEVEAEPAQQGFSMTLHQRARTEQAVICAVNLPDQVVIRLHGPDREKMDERAGKDWSKIVEARDGEIAALAGMLCDLRNQGRKAWLFVNNHYYAASCESRRDLISRSSDASLRARSRVSESADLIFAKARTTKTLISTARLLLSTLAAMSAPCSVKTRGIFQPPAA